MSLHLIYTNENKPNTRWGTMNRTKEIDRFQRLWEKMCACMSLEIISNMIYADCYLPEYTSSISKALLTNEIRCLIRHMN
jgi:hypothetical protein